MTIEFNQLPPDRSAVKVAYADGSGITVHGNAKTRFCIRPVMLCVTVTPEMLTCL
jgi:hypothetical protein